MTTRASSGTAHWYGQAFAEFTTWAPARKTAFLLTAVLACHLAWYPVWEFFEDGYPGLYGPWLRPMMGLFILELLTFIGVCLWLIRIGSQSRLPVYLLGYGYGSSAIAWVYLSGLMDTAYTGFPFSLALACMLIDGWRMALRVSLFWIGVILLLMIGQGLDFLPLAPFITDQSAEARTSLAWMVPGYFFIVEILAFDLFMFWVVWNSRDQMQLSLERSRELIRRYIPPAVADHIVKGKDELIDAPQRRRITILFSDIIGFTDIADRVEPEVMTQVINEYMAVMSDIVDSHEGTVNEFIGDGLMAMFGAPEPLAPENQAKQAILSAQAMQAKLPELNQQWRKLGLGEELQVRIGINTGMASVGSFGSQGRMTYTAIGLQVNVAARIQSHCEPGGILMSDATYQLIADAINCKARGAVECKGVHFPVKVYAPLTAL